MDGGQPQTELRLPTTSEFMSSDDPMSPGGGTVHEFSFSARHLSASEVVADILHEHGANILVHCALIRSRDRITQEILRDTMQVCNTFQMCSLSLSHIQAFQLVYKCIHNKLPVNLHLQMNRNCSIFSYNTIQTNLEIEPVINLFLKDVSDMIYVLQKKNFWCVHQ